MIVVLQTKNILNEHIKMSKKDAPVASQETLKNTASLEENRDIYVKTAEKHLRTLKEVTQETRFGGNIQEVSRLTAS